jgi:hypothetical protein
MAVTNAMAPRIIYLRVFGDRSSWTMIVDHASRLARVDTLGT